MTGSALRSRVTDQRLLLRALGLGSRLIGQRGAAAGRAFTAHTQINRSRIDELSSVRTATVGGVGGWVAHTGS